VELENVTESMAAIGVEGPEAAAVQTAVGAPVPEGSFAHAAWEDATVAAISLTGQPGFRIYCPAEQRSALVERLEKAGAKPANEDDARLVRIENGKPVYGEDIRETSLPQETQQVHALHFTKGCYIGQDIVERIRSLGHVNRLLMGLRIDSIEPPAAETKLSSEGSEAGEITSAGFSPALGKVVALGYLRAQYAVPGVTLKAGDADAITTPVAGSRGAGPAQNAGY